jgi:2-C-methyl-D-erythritol 4-phosphate cytidylyltransferase
MNAGAVIVAAGRSSRMGGSDKLLQTIQGRPLIAHTLAPFLQHTAIRQAVLVVSSENREAISRQIGRDEKLTIVLGGERRRDSVHAGLVTLTGCDYALVHDGARPLVTSELIDSALAGARECGAALCAVAVTDTVKRSDESGHIRGTVEREGLWLAQTPQAFRLDLILQAHRALEGDFTDDAAMIEHLGLPVRLVAGSRRNIKVTTPDDLALAAMLLALPGSPGANI